MTTGNNDLDISVGLNTQAAEAQAKELETKLSKIPDAMKRGFSGLNKTLKGVSDDFKSMTSELRSATSAMTAGMENMSAGLAAVTGALNAMAAESKVSAQKTVASLHSIQAAQEGLASNLVKTNEIAHKRLDSLAKAREVKEDNDSKRRKARKDKEAQDDVERERRKSQAMLEAGMASALSQSKTATSQSVARAQTAAKSQVRIANRGDEGQLKAAVDFASIRQIFKSQFQSDKVQKALREEFDTLMSAVEGPHIPFEAFARSRYRQGLQAMTPAYGTHAMRMSGQGALAGLIDASNADAALKQQSLQRLQQIKDQAALDKVVHDIEMARISRQVAFAQEEVAAQATLTKTQSATLKQAMAQSHGILTKNARFNADFAEYTSGTMSQKRHDRFTQHLEAQAQALNLGGAAGREYLVNKYGDEFVNALPNSRTWISNANQRRTQLEEEQRAAQELIRAEKGRLEVGKLLAQGELNFQKFQEANVKAQEDYTDWQNKQHQKLLNSGLRLGHQNLMLNDSFNNRLEDFRSGDMRGKKADRFAKQLYLQRQALQDGGAQGRQFLLDKLGSDYVAFLTSGDIDAAIQDAAANSAYREMLGGRLPKQPKPPAAPKPSGNALSAANHARVQHDREIHSLNRGLAGGQNALWLTYGETMPIMAGFAASAAAGLAFKEGAQFKEQLAFISQVANDGTKPVAEFNQQIKDLGASLTEMGRNSQFSSVELAKGMRTLVQAGMTLEEAKSALPSTMNLAVAGEVSVDKSAEFLAGLRSVFKGSSTDEAANMTAKAADASQASIESMMESMRQASSVAQNYNVDLLEMSTMLSLLAERNIKGQAAGTAVRNLMIDLSGRTKETTKLLADLGVTNSQKGTGKLLSGEDVLRQVVEKTSGMSEKDRQTALKRMLSERGDKAYAALFDSLLKTDKSSVSKYGKEMSVYETRKLDIATASENGGYANRKAAAVGEEVSKGATAAVNAFKSAAIDAFVSVEPRVKAFVGTLREAFASAEFRQGFQSMLNGLVTLADAAVKYSGPILTLAKGLATLLAAKAGFSMVNYLAAGLSNAYVPAQKLYAALAGLKGAAAAASLGNLASEAKVVGLRNLASSGSHLAASLLEGGKTAPVAAGALRGLGAAAVTVTGFLGPLGAALSAGALLWTMYADHAEAAQQKLTAAAVSISDAELHMSDAAYSTAKSKLNAGGKLTSRLLSVPNDLKDGAAARAFMSKTSAEMFSMLAGASADEKLPILDNQEQLEKLFKESLDRLLASEKVTKEERVALLKDYYDYAEKRELQLNDLRNRLAQGKVSQDSGTVLQDFRVGAKSMQDVVAKMSRQVGSYGYVDSAYASGASGAAAALLNTGISEVTTRVTTLKAALAKADEPTTRGIVAELSQLNAELDRYVKLTDQIGNLTGTPVRGKVVNANLSAAQKSLLDVLNAAQANQKAAIHGKAEDGVQSDTVKTLGSTNPTTRVPGDSGARQRRDNAEALAKSFYEQKLKYLEGELAYQKQSAGFGSLSTVKDIGDVKQSIISAASGDLDTKVDEAIKTLSASSDPKAKAHLALLNQLKTLLPDLKRQQLEQSIRDTQILAGQQSADKLAFENSSVKSQLSKASALNDLLRQRGDLEQDLLESSRDAAELRRFDMETDEQILTKLDAQKEKYSEIRRIERETLQIKQQQTREASIQSRYADGLKTLSGSYRTRYDNRGFTGNKSASLVESAQKNEVLSLAAEASESLKKWAGNQELQDAVRSSYEAQLAKLQSDHSLELSRSRMEGNYTWTYSEANGKGRWDALDEGGRSYGKNMGDYAYAKFDQQGRKNVGSFGGALVDGSAEGVNASVDLLVNNMRNGLKTSWADMRDAIRQSMADSLYNFAGDVLKQTISQSLAHLLSALGFQTSATYTLEGALAANTAAIIANTTSRSVGDGVNVASVVFTAAMGGVAGGGTSGFKLPGGGGVTFDQNPVDGIMFKTAATGGLILGPGTGTSDSIPARLSNGEYVIRADAVAKYGTGFLDSINSGRASRPKFATGGLVGKAGGGSYYNGIIMNVNVTTLEGTTAKVEHKQNANGGTDLNIMIEKVEAAVANNVYRGGSQLGKALEARYGLKRQGV